MGGCGIRDAEMTVVPLEEVTLVDGGSMTQRAYERVVLGTWSA